MTNTTATTTQSNAPGKATPNELLYTGVLYELPAAEPKRKIVSWNYEPLHETYSLPSLMNAAV